MKKKSAKGDSSTKRGKLHPVSFQKFVQEIYQDAELKAQVISELNCLGFSAFADKHFALISRQKKELDTIQDKDCEALFTDAVVAALHRNGSIELIHEGHNPPNMAFDFYARWTDHGPEVGVRIHC